MIGTPGPAGGPSAGRGGFPVVARAAVLGRPVSHSLSPVLHRAAYAALGLDGWRYEAIECDESGLAPLLKASGPEVLGYSCTMPLKREVLRVAASVSAEAAAIGAGNTLVRQAGRAPGWLADNTDWIGIRDALAARGISPAGRVAVLGAGGTAQAALAALADAHRVTVLVRDPSRTTDLVDTAGRLNRDVRVGRFSEPADLAALRDADLVLSTLPPGAADFLVTVVGERTWAPGQALLDAVYVPWPTALAGAAAAAGAAIVSGASMLLYQAVHQVELMTGRAAPVGAMRVALLAAAPGCAA